MIIFSGIFKAGGLFLSSGYTIQNQSFVDGGLRLFLYLDP